MSNIPLKILVPLVTLLISSLPVLVTSQVSPNDEKILLKMKEQWKNEGPMKSWNTSTPHCLWQGVQCSDGDTTVTGISLASLNLDGQIPPSICDLPNLTTLDLSGNTIIGHFPTFLYKCTNLETLSLSQNNFVGSLPNDLSSLSHSLKHLDLSYNNFSGSIPSSIGQLKGLLSLHLEENLFTGTFPKEIGSLDMLQELVLENNPFSPMTIPQEFGYLKSLKTLWMSHCNLIGNIPSSFNNLSSIEMLDLSDNQLTGEIPNGLLLLNNLTYLYLYNNTLLGGLPASIEAVNMVELDVSMNSLTGPIPEQVSKLQGLQVLSLCYNKFNGSLPSSIGLMPLTKLKVFHNMFHGTLPQDIGLHSKLKVFDVSDNGFTGQLPQHLCQGGVLLGVVAYNNRLNGTIPTSLGDCDSLFTLQLYNNSFSGEVPNGLWTFRTIYSIQLSHNQFSGHLPHKLAWNMTRLEVDNNQFSGQIPESVKDWGHLAVFKAGNNMISGRIPMELTRLSHLNSLQLAGNQLSGQLPFQLSSWQKLNYLDLSNNHLSGSIPSGLGSLPVLNYLDLSSNQFSGQIPPELGNLKLNSLNLSYNKLSGRIPFGLDNDGYDNSFVSSGLCSDTGVSDLPKCSVFGHRSKTLSPKYLALVLLLALLAFLATSYFTMCLIGEFRRRQQDQDLATWKLTSFHKLDFTEERVLGSLNESNIIGSGGSGEVYRIPVNRCVVAVKRIWSNRKMKSSLEKEFLAETQILGTIRHLNIVKLLCCISSDSSKLLVYEYMENQSLDQWIHQVSTDNNRVLEWPARLRVAIGAAQGLSYMHHDCSPPIIHRDVKSSNILLDSEFNAKIADFGLARILVKPGGQPNTVSSVAGSFGYMAPEYWYTSKVNEKIDIYSFGVVLLELVTGKEAHTGDQYSNLAEWAWKHYREGGPIEEVLDKEVKGVDEYVQEMRNVWMLGLMCTSTLPSSRPTMKEVLQVLKRCSSSSSALQGVKERDQRDASPLLGKSKKGASQEDASS